MVKFGAYLQANKDEEFANYYISYSDLKDCIDKILSKVPNAEATFLNCLESEWSKYKAFVDNWLEKFLSSKVTKQSVIPIIQMNAFMYINQECLRKIIKKHDKNSEMKLTPSWEWKINSRPFLRLIPIIRQVSKLHSHFIDPPSPSPKFSDPNKIAHKHQVFWVPQERIMPLICLLIQHLPMKTFGFGDNESLSQTMHTVYLDNTDLEQYHEILTKPDNAETVQLQFTDSHPEEVFVVKKKGRKGYFSDISVAEDGSMSLAPGVSGAAQADPYERRSIISSSNMSEFLRNGKMPQSCPNDENTRLANVCGDTVTSLRLQPMISTDCQIMQFEVQGSNSMRCAMEINITMIREWLEKDQNKDKDKDSSWYTPMSHVKQGNVYKFPFGVLNVYTQGTYAEQQPEWFHKIMKQSDLLLEQVNFSKYAHATYTFLSKKTKIAPHWITKNPNAFSIEKDQEKAKQTVVHNMQSLTKHDGGNSSDEDDVNDPDNDVKVYRMSPNTRRDSNYKSHEISYKPIDNIQNPSPGNSEKKTVLSDVQRDGTLHFQNEHVFLYWLLASLLVGLTGVLIILLGLDSNITSVKHWDIGAVFVILAMVMILITLLDFYIRSDAINKRNYDYSGSTVLYIISIGIIIAFIVPLVAYRNAANNNL